MKNKKKKIGFTLIELLAVIIVLAIIALIATPIIFNVIENAKLKSLENSCYGVIDAVRTKYAEGLLNSENGTVKLSGDVKDITVSGEQPIEGTWEIDNSSDSDNRGIKIKDVKFASMKDYTCTNVNSDGTINSKVTCTKGGSDALVETDLSCFEYKDIFDYDIDVDACIKKFENTSPDNDTSVSIISHEEAVGICNGNTPYAGAYYIDELVDTLLLNSKSDSIKELIDSETVKLKTNFNIDVDGCVAFLTGGKEVSDEELTIFKGMCNGEIPIEGNVYIKEYLINSVISGDVTIEGVEQLGVLEQNYIPKRRVITGYTCDSKDIVIPEQITAISEVAFNEKEITSVDFRKAKNLKTISIRAFQTNKINSIDLSGATNLTTIGAYAFDENEISNIKLPSNIKAIGGRAFSQNKIANLDFNKLTNLTEIAGSAFAENKITNVDLSNMKNLTIISDCAFENNEISSLKLPNNYIKLVKIGQFAFGNNLLSGELDLSNFTNLSYVSGFENNQLTNVVFPSSITTITDSAFSSNKLTSITIPNSVTTITSHAFSDNPNLTSIKIDKTENSIEGSPWGADNATITWLR